MEQSFRVGEWDVRPDLGTLTRGETFLRLEPRVMEVLVYLAEHAGDVVSKERLVQAVWTDLFVTDDVLKQAIFQLRKAFDDDSKGPRYIETIPRRGYRLIAEVVFPEADREESPKRYRLIQQIAEGGMGEVWLAEDRPLGRRVVLKFLRREKEADEIANRRLRREARAAAALDHPFICKVYDTGLLDGRSFIAMEYVEGETLKERLRNGPRPLREALGIAREMAEALEAAHRKGIVHRDIKPSNVILTEQGHVKITDFGIAKRFRKEAGEAGDWTLTEGAGESPGTPDYMSPEQIRGDPVDHRSDLFSFGIVLYEMLTGIHPFRRANRAETTAAILGAEPAPLRERSTEIPDLLEHVVRKLLAKDPTRRSPSMEGVHIDLERLFNDSEVTEKGASWFARALGGMVLAALLTAAFLLWYDSGLWSSRSFNSEPPTFTPFTTDGGFKTQPRFSPDGERVAYSWKRPDKPDDDIYVKALAKGSKPLQLTTDIGQDVSPAWSPDGREIAFLRIQDDGTSAIYRIPSSGGREQVLGESLSVPRFLGCCYLLRSLSWSPDGNSLLYSETESPEGPARIVQFRTTTQEKRVLTSPPPDSLGDLNPEYSPDGESIIFERLSSKVFSKGDLWMMPARGGEPQRLTELQYEIGTRPAWTSDGTFVLFSCQRGPKPYLWQIDASTGARAPVMGLGQDVGHVSVWRDRLITTHLGGGGGLAPAGSNGEIWRVPGPTAAPGSSPHMLMQTPYHETNCDVSPKGRVVYESDRSGATEIWSCESDGSNALQLTEFGVYCGTPRWDPDGSRIVFDSLQSENWDLWVLDRPDGGLPRRLTHSPADDGIPSWSTDGQWIYFYSTRTGRSEIFKISAAGGEAEPVTRNGGIYARMSWDGAWLYFSKTWDIGSLWRLPTQGGPEEQLPIEVDGVHWTVGQRGVYVARREIDEYSIQLIDPETGSAVELHHEQGAGLRKWVAVSPGEGWILFSMQEVRTSELMLVENFRPSVF